MRLSSFAVALALSACVASAGAQTLLQGFEGGTAALSNTSPAGQSQNFSIPRGTAQNSDVTYITQGSASCQLTHTWLLDAAATSAADPYEVGGPTQLFWSIRAHFGAANTISTAFDKVEVDVYNASGYAIDAAIMIHDGNYKRHPWVSLAPNAWTKLSWDVKTVPGLPAVIGNATGLLNPAGPWAFRGIAVHTTTQPADASFTMYVDNLVGISAQSDTTPPSAPEILKVEQGSAPGKAKVTWAANAAGDGVAKYTINYADAASWQRQLPNRLATNVVATKVDVVGGSATTGEIDVSTTTTSYIFVTATDGATPNPNASGISRILSVRLNADGSAPKTLVVLDNKRYTPASGVDFSTYGYEQMSAYYGVALSTNNEPYEMAVSSAVDGGQQVLTASPDDIVIWSAGVDGLTSTTAISDASATAMTNFVNGGGKLFITGAHAVEGLYLADTPASLKTFAENVLKVDLVNGNVAQTAINNLAADGYFASVGNIATGTDVFYTAAGSISANDSLLPRAGAIGAGVYDAVADIPIVYSGRNVVVFGFGFEQVRDPAANTADTAGAAAGAAKRAIVMQTVMTYLRSTAPTAVSDWSMYE